MPLYDFKCDGCGRVTEDWARMEQRELECSKCGHSMRRLISSPGAVLFREDYYDVGPNGEAVLVRSKKELLDRLKQDGGEFYSKYYDDGFSVAR